MASLSHENCAQCINHHPIVFIDSKIDDYQSLVNGTIPQAEVIVLDPGLDGVIQITSVLVGRQDICAIHIVSHGAPGCLDLGSSKLSLDTLEYYASQLESWTSDSSVPLLLYGCNVATGDAGGEFLAKLHHLTGEAIAATANPTGNAQQGGTWQLEVNIGAASSWENQPLAFTATTQATYRGIFGITRVSVAEDGTQGNGDSSNPAFSADGRFVAFQSTASNLVASDTNNRSDIFVRDILTGTITLVSLADNGTQRNFDSSYPAISADGRFVVYENGGIYVRDILTGTNTRVSVADDGTSANGNSFLPAISAEGRFVAFSSRASNLVADDTNNSVDIFVRDIEAGTTTRVSVANDGTEGNNLSYYSAISASGRFVAFLSSASDLVARDTNNSDDIFVSDIEAGTTTRVSVADDGTEGNSGYFNFYNRPSTVPFPVALSGDGGLVAFASFANNLVALDTNNRTDIFVREINNPPGDPSFEYTKTRVSIADDGTQGIGNSTNSAVDASGRFVAFVSSANNLVAEDTNNRDDIFVRDIEAGTTTRVSVADDGTQGNNESSNPAISASGRFVAFVSRASNLVAEDTNNTSDIFVRDREAGTTILVSVADDGTQANNFSSNPAISAEGRFVAFQSSASNLVAGDNIGGIFVRDIEAGTTTRVSVANDGTQGSGSNPAISADGRFVAFESSANNLVAEDTDNTGDIFVRDIEAGTTTLVSVANDGILGNSGFLNPTISADGRFVAFESGPRRTNNGFRSDILVRDLLMDTTTQFSVAKDGTALANGRSSPPAISADGRFVAFVSELNIFVRDLLMGTTTRVSVADDGTRANVNFGFLSTSFFSDNPAISADGSFVAFESTANNLVARDTNNRSDIFIRPTNISPNGLNGDANSSTDMDSATVVLGANINTTSDDHYLSPIGAEMATLSSVDPNTLNQLNFTNATA